ncbi:hypothetical protein CSW18_02100 [Thermus scotoductus]|uniref:PIN domain-containing protein n=1 Tax=Thermus scotoductus TaxID=37636 RepID=A0A430S335_THESC|nr:hypothetical protein CSW40_01410 [Thermus scotoductus]RTI42045.1 hypothetical protein CSW18_02100 [Thermus scotoductus]
MPADIAYLDASALVKRYVAEPGTEAVQALLARAAVVGTAARTSGLGAWPEACARNPISPEVQP